MMHRLLKIEWDAIAGVLATVTAIMLHDVLSMITLVLIAAMFLRLLRSEHRAATDRGRRGSRRTSAGPARA